MIDASEHIGLVHVTVKRMCREFDDKEEMTGVAMVALCRAANRFDPTLGYRFSTYAVRAIRNAIFRQWELQTLPTKGHDRTSQMCDAVMDSLGRLDPTPEFEIAERRRHAADMVAELLEPLDDRSREVVIAQMEGLSHEQIAKCMGLDRSSVTRIAKSAMYYMRQHAGLEPEPC